MIFSKSLKQKCLIPTESCFLDGKKPNIAKLVDTLGLCNIKKKQIINLKSKNCQGKYSITKKKKKSKFSLLLYLVNIHSYVIIEYRIIDYYAVFTDGASLACVIIVKKKL